MARYPAPPPSLPAFAQLPVRYVRLRDGVRVAVHASGRFAPGRVPVVGLADYHRNMADFADFVPLLRQSLGEDWPVLLIDLPGRGRSEPARRPKDYAIPNDAETVSAVAAAFGIAQAAFVGQGHGGQVVMALTALRPGLIDKAVLIDAGPAVDAAGLVRLRTNVRHILASRSRAAAEAAIHKMLLADYPGHVPFTVGKLGRRLYFFDEKGRVKPLFDIRLIDRLDRFSPEDSFEPQWMLFKGLQHVPLMLMHAELSDRLRADLLDDMTARRPDAVTLTVEDQGDPVLLDDAGQVFEVATFIAPTQARAPQAPPRSRPEETLQRWQARRLGTV